MRGPMGRRLALLLALAAVLAGLAAGATRLLQHRSVRDVAPATTAPRRAKVVRSVASVVRVRHVRRAARTDVYARTGRGDRALATAGVRARVYVPDSLSNRLDVIDPRTYRVVASYRVGALPHHVTPSWDLRHLYVDDTAANALTVIDPRSGRPTGKIPVEDPYNLYFTPDGTRAIVVAERFSRLDFRRPHSWRLVRSVPLPGRGADHLDFSADGRFLLVSDEFSGDLVKVDVARAEVVATAHVGGFPVDVKLSPDGSAFYVANQGRGGVSIFDADRMREAAFLRTGAGAHGLAIARDGADLYVSNRLAGTISVVSFAKRRVEATWRVGGSPDMLQVSPDGRELWASDRYGGTVSVVSTRTGRLLHRIPVGGGPHGLSYFPQPGRFSLGHNGVYR